MLHPKERKAITNKVMAYARKNPEPFRAIDLIDKYDIGKHHTNDWYEVCHNLTKTGFLVLVEPMPDFIGCDFAGYYRRA